MGMYLNRNNDNFTSSVKSKYFQDKSDLLKVLNERLDTEDRFVCITRPRRFGKTVNTNMIDAYYSKGCDSHSLFDGLDISKDKDYETHLNKYNVIHLDMAKFINTKDIETGNEIEKNMFINNMERLVCNELHEVFPSYVKRDYLSLTNALINIHSKTGIKFIMLIDEWDAPLRDKDISKTIKDKYIDFLRSLFKEQTGSGCFSLGYLTGIIPIKKVTNQSALNNFRESTMIMPGLFAPYFGFTKEEVQKLCIENNMSYEDAESWYDGYILGGLHIFNPNSIVEYILNREVGSYWGNTASFENVTEYISCNYNGLRTSIISALGGAKVPVNTTKFKNDIFSFKGKDDVLTLLIHLGYLGYEGILKGNRIDGRAFVPNAEIRGELENAVEDTSWKKVIEMLGESDELLQNTLSLNEKEVCEGLQKAQRSVSSILTYNKEESLSLAILLAYYSANNEYIPFRELPTGKGFADVVYLPKKGVDKPALIIELKWDYNATTAISQIKDRVYTEKISEYTGDILLVGVSYNKKRKGSSYSCKIEKYKK